MSRRSFPLTGIDGANPLGFLAALGTLITLHRGSDPTARLRWQRGHTWVPVLEHVSAVDEAGVAQAVAAALRGRTVSPGAEQRLYAAQKEMEAAQTRVKKKRQEIRARGLSRSERAEALEQELLPLQAALEAARLRWLEARRAAVPSLELALGRRIEDCGKEEYRDLAQALLGAGDIPSRDTLDLLAAFCSNACLREANQIEPTPFEFATGSGHQFFLETVRQLMDKADAERVRQVLFQPWEFRDEGLSLRWDPSEDRRYALLDRDPTANDNKPRTVWMANLLAYRALAFFPTTPTRRGLAATGWTQGSETLAFTWPLWEFSASLDTVRTILQTADLVRDCPDMSILRARGIAAVYRSQRVEVGSGIQKKLNFSPARQVV